MSFKVETEAFDRLLVNLDQGFQRGAFGLTNAMQIVPDVQAVANLLNTPEPELIKRFLATPAPAQEVDWEQEQEIAVTGDKVAKKLSK